MMERKLRTISGLTSESDHVTAQFPLNFKTQVERSRGEALEAW